LQHDFQKWAKQWQKIAHASVHTTQKTKIVEMQKFYTNIARGVRIMLELFGFQLCNALIHKKFKKCAALW